MFIPRDSLDSPQVDSELDRIQHGQDRALAVITVVVRPQNASGTSQKP